MKVNAPEKIYLQVCGDCKVNECGNCKFEDLEDNVTWCKDKIFEKDIEYIRTDAFIEKACEWLKENKDHPLIGCEDPCLSGYLTSSFIENFRKAMKGESKL